MSQQQQSQQKSIQLNNQFNIKGKIISKNDEKT